MPTEKNPTGYSLGTDGYFYHHQHRFIPAGVNYWPASCGVDVWQQWPADEIQHDLDLLVKLKLNSMRFFLRWQDFEPTAGQYDERMFQRLDDWLGWFRERGLAAHPSLFVGWMSGGTFYPQWFAGRNPFSDPELVRRMEAFVCKAGEVLAPYHDSVLAVDQGNEIDCLPEAQSAPPAAVIEWCRRFNQSFRGTYPQALIVSGCDQNQVMNDTGWRLGQQPGVDFYSMHGYPVPQWHPLRFDGMTDPLMQSFLPTYVNLARAFGATMLQEFGTIATFGVKQQESYLRGMLPAAWEAGANGFLWWCLRDVTARLHPYTRNNMESTLGLVDEHDRIKPGLLHFIEFAHSLQERPPVDFTSAEAGVYISSELYPRDNPHHSGHDMQVHARGQLLANYFLKMAGYRVQAVRGDLPIPAALKTLVVSGCYLMPSETDALAEWVSQGGHLLWHGPDPMNWGASATRLAGARPVDYYATRTQQVTAFGQTWQFSAYPRSNRVAADPMDADVLARDESDLPVLLRHRLGKGCVVTALPLVEEGIAAYADNRQARDRWLQFYLGELREMQE